MSERWKFQLRFGLLFALFYTFMMCLMSENSLEDELNSTRFYLRSFTNILLGVFFVGYVAWKGQDEKNNSWSFLFRNKTKK